MESCNKLSVRILIPPLISHFQHGLFTLAQTIESLKIGQAFHSLRFREAYQIHISNSWNEMQVKDPMLEV